MKIFALFFYLKYCTIFETFRLPLSMAKKQKKSRGRPKGAEKEAMNLYITKDRAERLREFAGTEQKAISIIVENALENTYGI